jgi:multiple sugar transport system permease protein
MKTSTRSAAVAWCFLMPNFLGFCLFTLGPVIFSLGAAFTNWSLIRSVPLQFIGFGNFIELWQDDRFWLYAINTVYLMLGMPFSIAGSLLLASMLSQKLRGMVVYRTLFYLPTFTAGVALFILWKKLYNPEFGPINLALQALFNLDSSQLPLWLASTANLLAIGVERVELVSGQFGLGARDAIIIMGIWVTVGGGNMLLYLAGISNIPQELYEAASIDGAGAWARFRHVTWPQLAPTTFFIFVMSFIGGLQGGFEQARVMTNGGPAGTTTTLSFYIYTKAFEEFQIGYASAVAWVLFSVIFAVTLLNWKFGSRYVNY